MCWGSKQDFHVRIHGTAQQHPSHRVTATQFVANHSSLSKGSKGMLLEQEHDGQHSTCHAAG